MLIDYGGVFLIPSLGRKAFRGKKKSNWKAKWQELMKITFGLILKDKSEKPNCSQK